MFHSTNNYDVWTWYRKVYDRINYFFNKLFCLRIKNVFLEFFKVSIYRMQYFFVGNFSKFKFANQYFSVNVEDNEIFTKTHFRWILTSHKILSCLFRCQLFTFCLKITISNFIPKSAFLWFLSDYTIFHLYFLYYKSLEIFIQYESRTRILNTKIYLLPNTIYCWWLKKIGTFDKIKPWIMFFFQYVVIRGR